MTQQSKLNAEQVAEFYHDLFVSDQVRHFRVLAMPVVQASGGTVVDIGGGVGHFAKALQQHLHLPTRVFDLDPVSVQACREAGLDAEVGDALNLPVRGDEAVVCLNLILHHLVAPSASATKNLQRRAIRPWRCRIFVNEYIYESYIGNLSGWLIYQVTSNRWLSALAKAGSRLVPALRANTFGVGVRFRANKEWVDLFRAEGFEVERVEMGEEEPVATPWRLLLIKSIRRDSFLLRPMA